MNAGTVTGLAIAAIVVGGMIGADPEIGVAKGMIWGCIAAFLMVVTLVAIKMMSNRPRPTA